MTGSGNCTADVVAWPANGITLAISGFQACDMWTCEFYNGLTATDNTTVTIKCLNNGEEWFIDSQNLNSNQDYNGDGSLISFADSSISMRLGGVYEITIDHLNNENGEDTSYTYRSVYESGDDDSDTEGKVKSIAFKSSDTTVDIGSKKQLNVKISPLDADNRRLYFTSENPEIATVTAYGEVKGIAEGTTTIIATSEDGNFTSKCKVTVKKHEHKIITIGKKSATYFAVGSTGYKKCKICGKKLSTSKTVAKKKLSTPVVKVKVSSKKTIKVSYKKISAATRYQIRYREVGKSKWISKKTKKLSTNLTKLKSRKKYQIKVRAIKVKGSKKAYSNWSKVKTIKTK